MRRQMELNPAAEDVLAQIPAMVSFRDGPIHVLDQIPELAANVDVALLRAHRQTRDDNALDQLVRIEFHQQPVFAGARLGFVRVHHDVLRLGRLPGQKAPLHAGRKAGATAPAQPRSFHFVDDFVLRHPERFFDRFIAVVGEIRLDAMGIRKVEAARQNLHFKRIRLVIHQLLTFCTSLICSGALPALSPSSSLSSIAGVTS